MIISLEHEPEGEVVEIRVFITIILSHPNSKYFIFIFQT